MALLVVSRLVCLIMVQGLGCTGTLGLTGFRCAGVLMRGSIKTGGADKGVKVLSFVGGIVLPVCLGRPGPCAVLRVVQGGFVFSKRLILCTRPRNLGGSKSKAPYYDPNGTL